MATEPTDRDNLNEIRNLLSAMEGRLNKRIDDVGKNDERQP